MCSLSGESIYSAVSQKIKQPKSIKINTFVLISKRSGLNSEWALVWKQ